MNKSKPFKCVEPTEEEVENILLLAAATNLEGHDQVFGTFQLPIPVRMNQTFHQTISDGAKPDFLSISFAENQEVTDSSCDEMTLEPMPMEQDHPLDVASEFDDLTIFFLDDHIYVVADDVEPRQCGMSDLVLDFESFAE